MGQQNETPTYNLKNNSKRGKMFLTLFRIFKITL